MSLSRRPLRRGQKGERRGATPFGYRMMPVAKASWLRWSTRSSSIVRRELSGHVHSASRQSRRGLEAVLWTHARCLVCRSLPAVSTVAAMRAAACPGRSARLIALEWRGAGVDRGPAEPRVCRLLASIRRRVLGCVSAAFPENALPVCGSMRHTNPLRAGSPYQLEKGLQYR